MFQSRVSQDRELWVKWFSSSNLMKKNGRNGSTASFFNKEIIQMKRHRQACRALCSVSMYLFKIYIWLFFSMVVKHDHSLKRPPTRPKTKTDVGQVVVYFYLSEVKLKIFRAGSVSSTVKRWVSVLLIHRAQGCSFRLSLLFCSCYWLNLGFLFFFFFWGIQKSVETRA